MADPIIEMKYVIEYKDRFDQPKCYKTSDRVLANMYSRNKTTLDVYAYFNDKCSFCLTGFKDYEPNPYTGLRYRT